MGDNKNTSSKKYISLEDFHNISNISLNTIKKNIERIPGIEKEKESFKVLRGTRYPANMRRFKSNEFARKRYQLLKAICEDRYVDEVMLRCDKLQFEDFIKELLKEGYIKQNCLYNDYGANRYDSTPKGDDAFNTIKAKRARQHFLSIAETTGVFCGTAVAYYENHSA